MKKQHSSAELPWELINDILSRLPVKSLMRFRCISRSCNDLITDPTFINLHLARSLESNSDISYILLSFRPKPIIYSLKYHHNSYHVNQLGYPNDIIFPPRNSTLLVGSCNGLLCFESSERLSLYNPATRAYRKLPDTKLKRDMTGLSHFFAFGYDSASNDYKVVKFITPLEFRSSSEKIEYKSLLYSLKKNAWEIIPSPPWNVKYLKTASGVLTNNSLHWMTRECTEIKCFNLHTLDYYEFPLPARISKYSPKLTKLKGQLCVVTYYLDIWVLREYGVDKLWTRLFRHLSRQLYTFYSLDNWDIFRIACLKDGRNITLLVYSDGQLDRLIICDVESENATRIQMLGKPKYQQPLSTIQPWVESLVTL